jgi:hypothetical protein
MRTLTLKQEHDCLAADPFAGDMGTPGDRTLRKQMVTARKPHAECACCLGPIAAGERTRVQIEFFDRQMQDYRWCSECCWAMARSWKDSGKAWEAREILRQRKGVVA